MVKTHGLGRLITKTALHRPLVVVAGNHTKYIQHHRLRTHHEDGKR